MRSKWIEHKGRKIFYQDFSCLFFNAADVKAELREVQAVVLAEPSNSVLALSDFRDTNVDSHLLPDLNAFHTCHKTTFTQDGCARYYRCQTDPC